MNAISFHPFVIGVAGGSGSGKSTVSQQVLASFGADMVSVVMQDDYYRDQSDLSPDVRRKQSGFGKIKMMLQRDLLVLPREPELLKQLRGLEYETSAVSGSVKISVPERAGHDDIAMALMQALSCVRPASKGPGPDGDGEIPERPGLAHTVTPSGIRVPAQPRPVAMHAQSYCVPAGREATPSAAW